MEPQIQLPGNVSAISDPGVLIAVILSKSDGYGFPMEQLVISQSGNKGRRGTWRSGGFQ